MDVLRRHGLSGNMSRSEVLFALGPLSYGSLLDLRLALYHEAIRQHLVDSSVSLVNRRDSACKPISIKLAQDIWTLINCLQHEKAIPRSLLKNGKRDLQSFEMLSSQSASCMPDLTCTLNQSADDSPSSSSSDSPCQSASIPLIQSPCQPQNNAHPPGPSCHMPASSFPPASSVALSALMREFNIAKADIASLKSSVSALTGAHQSDQALRDEVAQLSSLYSRISSPSDSAGDSPPY